MVFIAFRVAPGKLRRVLVTASILNILFTAGVLVPNYIRARVQGQLTACKSSLKGIGIAIEMYASEHKYPGVIEPGGVQYSPGWYEPCKYNIEILAKALNGYARDHEGFYPLCLSMLVPYYIPELPCCHSSFEPRVLEYRYRLDASMKRCQILCVRRDHPVGYDSRPAPCFDSDRGIVE